MSQALERNVSIKNKSVCDESVIYQRHIVGNLPIVNAIWIPGFTEDDKNKIRVHKKTELCMEKNFLKGAPSVDKLIRERVPLSLNLSFKLNYLKKSDVD